MYAVKARAGNVSPEAEWIPLSEADRWADKPRWSPDGNTIYHVSERDGSMCLWAQPLHPETRRPNGAPTAIAHFHRNRLSPINVGTALLEIDVAKDKIVIGLAELTGNIWSVSKGSSR